MNTAINALIDQDFSVDSYCDFMSHCQKKVNSFLAEIQRVIDVGSNPDIDTDNMDFPTTEQLQDRLSAIGMDLKTIISCDDGFVTAQSFIEQLESQYASYYAGEIDSLGSANINLTNSLGGSVVSSIDDVLDSVKTNYYGSLGEKFSLMSAKYDSVSDRITNFMTLAQNTLDLGDSSVLASLNFYKEKLLSLETPYELFNQFMSKSGAEQLDYDQDPFSLKDFDIYQYTGANPLGTLSFSCVSDALHTTGKIIGQAATGIWNAIKKGSNWVWNKAKKYTVEIFSDPYDVTDNGNSKAKYCFDNFQYQRTYTEWAYPTNPDCRLISIANTPYAYAEISDIAQTCLNHWYVIKTIGGEVAINPSDIQVTQDQYNENLLYVDYKGTVLFKPYSLNPDIDTTTYQTTVDSATGLTQGMYLGVDASEKDLFNAFTFGTTITDNILEVIGAESGNAISPVWNPTWQQPASGYQLTNLDWLKKATGYRVDGYGYTWFDKPTYCSTDLATLGYWLLLTVIMCTVKTNNYQNQLFSDYTPFTKDSQGMSLGRFGIKTDSENQDIANTFTIALVSIAIIAVVIITGAVIIRKAAKKLWWKRTEFVGRCDNAMWNGNILSSRDKRKYIRYSRKLNASQLISKGITAAETVSEKLQSQSDSIATTISNVMKGYQGDTSTLTFDSLRKLITG